MRLANQFAQAPHPSVPVASLLGYCAPMRSQRVWPYSRVISIIGIALVAALRPVEFTNDSQSYIDNHVVRTIAYPLFLDLHQAIFGSWFPHAVAVTQHLLGAFAAWRLATSLSILFPASRHGDWLGALLLFSPQLRYGASIMTESLAFTIVLAFLRSLVGALEEPTSRRLSGSLAWACLGILVRPQMLILLPTLLMVVVLTFRRRGVADGLKLGASFVLLLGGAWLIQCTYAYATHRFFGKIPFTGIQLLTVVIYVTQPSDLDAVPEGREREFAEQLYAEADRQHLLLVHKPRGMAAINHLYAGYNRIAGMMIGILAGMDQRTAEPRQAHVALDAKAAANWELTPAQWVRLDQTTVGIAKHLLKRSWRRYVLHVGKVAYQSSGYFGLLTLLLAGVAVTRLAWRWEAPWALVLTATAMWISNRLIVCMVEGFEPRYGFYTDVTLLGIVGFIFWSRAFPQGRGGAPGVDRRE
jgi:hypothetical protein